MQDPEKAATSDQLRNAHRTVPLSKRQREVVGLIALGLETPAIAKTLHISEHTVRAHVGNAKERLGARTRAHLVALALSQQLLNARDPSSPHKND